MSQDGQACTSDSRSGRVFRKSEPTLFLVTPVASHCALIGPVVPQSATHARRRLDSKRDRHMCDAALETPWLSSRLCACRRLLRLRQRQRMHHLRKHTPARVWHAQLRTCGRSRLGHLHSAAEKLCSGLVVRAHDLRPYGSCTRQDPRAVVDPRIFAGLCECDFNSNDFPSLK